MHENPSPSPSTSMIRLLVISALGSPSTPTKSPLSACQRLTHTPTYSCTTTKSRAHIQYIPPPLHSQRSYTQILLITPPPTCMSQFHTWRHSNTLKGTHIHASSPKHNLTQIQSFYRKGWAFPSHNPPTILPKNVCVCEKEKQTEQKAVQASFSTRPESFKGTGGKDRLRMMNVMTKSWTT